MFNFVPPAKVARTQRSSVSLAGVDRTGGGTTHRASHRVLEVSSTSFPTNASPRDSTAASHDFVRVDSPTECANVGSVAKRSRLCGVGSVVAWYCDSPFGHMLVWPLRAAEGSPPQVHAMPTFTPEEGVATFTAEWPACETVVVCSDKGAVKALNGRIDVQFQTSAKSDDTGKPAQLRIAAFCAFDPTSAGNADDRDSTEQLVLLAATSSSCVMVCRWVRGSPDAGIVDLRQLTIGAHRAATGQGWLSWLTGGRMLPSLSSSASAPAAASGEVTHILVTPSNAGRVWIATSDGPTLLAMDLCDAQFSLCASISLRNDSSAASEVRSTTASRNSGGSSGGTPEILAVCDGGDSDTLLALLFEPGAVPSSTTHRRGSLSVVTVSASRGGLLQHTAVSGLDFAANASSPSMFTGSAIPASIHRARPTETVTVVYGRFAVAINCAISVHRPCGSEEVDVLVPTGVEAGVLKAAPRWELAHATSQLSDTPFWVMTTTGQLECLYPSSKAALRVAGSPVTATDGNAAASVFPASPHSNANAATMSQKVGALLSAVQVDPRCVLDDAVMQASEDILQQCTLHTANWARADLNAAEDENLARHVTRQLQSRQAQHHLLLEELKRRIDVWAALDPAVASRLVSQQEQLRCLLTIRNLQNFSSERTSNVVTAPAFHGMDRICQRFLRQAVVDVAVAVRRRGGSEGDSFATAAELCFGKVQHVTEILHQLNVILAERLNTKTLSAGVKIEESVAVAAVFRAVVDAIDSFRSSSTTTTIHASFVPLGAAASSAASSSPSVAALVWTASGGADGAALEVPPVGTISASYAGQRGNNNGHLLPPLIDHAVLLSDFLASVVAGGEGALQQQQQQHTQYIDALSDIMTGFVQSILRYRAAACVPVGSFESNLLLRTLLHSPFAEHVRGYPFGTPMAHPPYLSVKQRLLRAAEDIAVDYSVFPVMFLICASHYAVDPGAVPNGGHFAVMESLCLRRPAFLEYCIQHLVRDGRREVEVVALPALLPRIENCAVVRDAFVRQHASQLHWQCVPHAFAALRKDGAEPQKQGGGGVGVAVGDDAVTHRSRCLSMAKLSWIAAGAPTAVASYDHMETDRCLVAAQREYLLPQTRNDVLSLHETVALLLKLPPNAASTTTTTTTSASTSLHQANAGPSDGGGRSSWVRAAQLASRAQGRLQLELLSMVLGAALAHDGVPRILEAGPEAISEKEFVERMRSEFLTTAVIAASPPLQDHVMLKEALIAACPCSDATSIEPQQLHRALMGWLALVRENS